MKLTIAIDPVGPQVLAITASRVAPTEAEVRTVLRRVATTCWAMADAPDFEYDPTNPEGTTA